MILSRLNRPQLTALDFAIAGVATLVAAAIRLPALQTIPVFTDEIHDMEFAQRIAQGGYWPIVSYDMYNGPGLYYLLALGMRLGGGALWPRFLVFILGSLTVGLSYFLGRSLAAHQRADAPAFQRLAGLLTAAFLAVSFVPIVVNSHLIWSNSTSPFWVALFLLAISEAVRRDRVRWLVPAGILGGLAWQTHPSIVVIILGAGLWVAVMRRAWLRSGWAWLGALMVLLFMSNLVLFTLTSGGANIDQAASRSYAWTGGASLSDYLVNVQGFLLAGYEMASSSFRSALPPEVRDGLLLSPPVILLGGMAVVALAYTARRAGLPLACWLVACLIIPYLNRRYNAYIEARYLAPLLPATYAAVGALLAAALLAAWPRAAALPGHSTAGGLTSRGAQLAVGLTAVGLIVLGLVYPLWRLQQYYDYQYASGRSNVRLWQMIAVGHQAHAEGAEVITDRGLKDVRMLTGMNIDRVFDTLSDLERIPLEKRRVERLSDSPVGSYLVLTDKRRDLLAPILQLEPVDVGEPIAPVHTSGYWIYRVVGR